MNLRVDQEPPLQEDMLIVFVSHAVTGTETRYTQIAEVADDCHLRMPSMTTYNVSKMTTETDHKPLITFVKKPLHAVPSCLQCMLLELQRYNLEFMYKRGK